jgi:sulfite reductase alpha subunit-like flavoprotein
MMEEKEILVNDLQNPYGNIHIYFGCRNSTEDFIYKSDIERLQKSGVVTSFKGAFSREDVGLSNAASQQGLCAARVRQEQGAALRPDL